MCTIAIDLTSPLPGNPSAAKRDEEDADVRLMPMLRTLREPASVGLGFDYQEGREKLG